MGFCSSSSEENTIKNNADFGCRESERQKETEMFHLIRLSTATNKRRLWYMNEMSVHSICAMILNRGKLRYSEKNLPQVPLGPPEIPHGLA